MLHDLHSVPIPGEHFGKPRQLRNNGRLRGEALLLSEHLRPNKAELVPVLLGTRSYPTSASGSHRKKLHWIESSVRKKVGKLKLIDQARRLGQFASVGEAVIERFVGSARNDRRTRQNDGSTFLQGKSTLAPMKSHTLIRTNVIITTVIGALLAAGFVHAQVNVEADCRAKGSTDIAAERGGRRRCGRRPDEW